ncbi:glycoside hydrolase family 32 protein [Salipaludibacillus aurantiacus]|uniref:Sucrose-6-phosphate hydrolase n=1 Tax=Salipaludibacillus aurantiacus TaxID=1601833 RepID=A0A1H9VAE7_9BACI|nr:sucrose-6-phosphate hydrolase [Salipaludibacillus aurantiacus]SES18501.1 beta-fructofuranosidase [Salipaludibacillus aurantiacus]
MTEREKELHQRAYTEVKKHQERVNADPYRQSFHLMPPAGLLNDPNGWIQWKGVYHLFYQWNPFACAHGAKFWGHFSSADMVKWKEEPVALAPSEWFEKNGCYSGSAVDQDGELALIYTGNVKDEEGNRESYQCMATSSDGVTFEKKGPVIDELPAGYTAHFRDPKVWKHNGSWYLVIGAQTTDEQGQALLYKSGDLKNWTFEGPIAGSHIGGLEEFGFMWECPDLFHLDGKDVLVVSPQGLEQESIYYQNTYQAGYFIGEMDYETPAFHHGDFFELDKGFEFYAPQTAVDDKGRRILTAWMGVPEQDEEYHPTIEHGWIHCLTVPRQLSVKGSTVIQQPVEELKELREKHVEHKKAEIGPEPVQLENVSGKSVELSINGLEGIEGIFETIFRGEARLVYNKEERLLTLERKNMKTRLTEQRHARVENLRDLQIYMDASSLEVFINGGETVMTSRFFPEDDDESILLKSSEKTSFTVEKWNLQAINK